MEGLRALGCREERVDGDLVGLRGSEFEHPGFACVEARRVRLVAERPACGRRRPLDLAEVTGEQTAATERRHVPGPGTGVAVVQGDQDVFRREHSEPAIEGVVADIVLRARRDHVCRGEGLVQAVFLVPALVPHLGPVPGEEDRDVVTGARALREPAGDALLDGVSRRVVIEQQPDIVLGHVVAHDQHVTDPPCVVLGAREVTPLDIAEVDVVADADHQRPVRQRRPLLRSEGE